MHLSHVLSNVQNRISVSALLNLCLVIFTGNGNWHVSKPNFRFSDYQELSILLGHARKQTFYSFIICLLRKVMFYIIMKLCRGTTCTSYYWNVIMFYCTTVWKICCTDDPMEWIVLSLKFPPIKRYLSRQEEYGIYLAQHDNKTRGLENWRYSVKVW